MSNRQLIRQIGMTLLSTAKLVLSIFVLVMVIIAVTLYTGLPELKLPGQRTSGPPATALSVHPQIPTPSPTLPTPVEGEQRLKTGEQSTWQFAAPGAGRPVKLSLEARLDFEKLAGSTTALEILVNSEPVMAPRLVNKALDFDYADGRTFAYFTPANTQQPYNLWTMFYSPDFSSNEQPGSGYQVLSGAPYRYEFDITPLLLSGRPNRLSLANHSEPAAEMLGRPLWLVIRNLEVEGIPLAPAR